MKKLLILLLYGLYTSNILAQDSLSIPQDTVYSAVIDSLSNKDSLLQATSLASMFEVAPLDTLIERAILNSAILKNRQAVVESKIWDLKISQHKWLDMASGFGALSFGSGNTLSSSDDGEGTNFQLSSQNSVIFNVGVNLRVSLYEFFTRGKENKKRLSVVTQARHDMEFIQQGVREEVIQRYTRFQLNLKLLKLKNSYKITQKINREVAKEYYLAGNMRLEEYHKILETAVKAEMEYETALSELTTSYYLLKEFVGGDVN